MVCLVCKYDNAEIGCKTTEAIYENLTKKLPQDDLKLWKLDEEEAMLLRGEALDIYQPKFVKSKIYH